MSTKTNPNIIQASGSTLTYIGGGSRKFYRIIVAGETEVRQWGRIGTTGQFSVTDHGGVRAAESSCEDQLSKKVKKGYSARRDIAFRFDATMLGGMTDEQQARALAAACDAAEAGANSDDLGPNYADELDELLEIESPPLASTETMQQVADRALSVVTLAATNSTDASVEYARLRQDMEAVEEQYDRCKGLLETIETMITARS